MLAALRCTGRRAPVLGLLLTVGLSLGCAPGPTGLTIGLITDAPAPGVLDSATITVSSPDGYQYTNRDNPWQLGPAATDRLPGTLSFYTEGGGTPRLTVTVTGYQAGQPIVTRTAELTLVEGQTLFLRMALSRDCLLAGVGEAAGPSCAAGLTCIDGQCQPPAVDGRFLPRYRAGIEELISCQSGSRYLDTRTNQPLPESNGGCEANQRCREAACLDEQAVSPTGDGGAVDGAPADGPTTDLGSNDVPSDALPPGCLSCYGPGCPVCLRAEYVVSNAGPWSMVVGPDSNVWYCDNDGQVGRLEPTTGKVTEFDLPVPTSLCSGLAPGATSLWFVENREAVGQVSTAGVFTEVAVPLTSAGQASDVRAVAIGPDGRLWFTEVQGNRVLGLTLPSTFAEFPLPTPSAGPRGIVVGPDGALWFTEHDANQIGRLDPSTSQVTEFPVPTPDTKPLGIIVGPDQNLWFTEEATDFIGRITPAGQVHEFLGWNNGNGTSDGPALVVGPDGNLWYYRNESLNVIGTDGAIRAHYDLPGYGYATVWAPDGLVYESNGTGKISAYEIRP
jgi:virginiamycin B lyase